MLRVISRSQISSLRLSVGLESGLESNYIMLGKEGINKNTFSSKRYIFQNQYIKELSNIDQTMKTAT